MLSIDQRRDILAARRRFFDGRPVSDIDVPAPILNSWRRCSERGFDIHLPPHLEPMSLTEMRQAVQRHEVLQRLCRPEIEALHAEAQSTDCIVILTDADGLILDTVGNVDFADRAAQVALRPGVPWAEATTGTNAIGAALIEGRPIKVHGVEHFFEPHGFLSCSAAPIFNPFGQIAGALDMSGPALANQDHAHQDHALGLVRLAVDQIEHRFFDSGFDGCEIMRFHRDPGLIGTTQEGILVFQERRLIAGNRRGLDLLDLDRHAFNRQSFDDLFDMQHGDRSARGAGALAATARQHLRSHSGEAFFAQCQGPQPRLQVELPSALPRLTPSSVLPSSQPVLPRQVEPVFDAATRTALGRAIRLIDADIPLLVRGETGSGKEIFAREIHRASQRAGRPFIAVNCAALPEGLIESELFGYEEGAFSGARRRGSKGLIREAANGLLFLDEIGDMPLSLQSRLLRVLQEREVRPLGGGVALPVDFSLICASHRDLQQMVTQGTFRADLYFRIAQYTVSLPCLREMAGRAGVIRKIWRGLGGAIGAGEGDGGEGSGGEKVDREGGITLAPASFDLLAGYDWPGNFRELVSTVRAVLALAEAGSEITPDFLPPPLRASAGSTVTATTATTTAGDRIAPIAAGDDLRQAQLVTMRRVLQECDGNVSKAARRLGIHRSTMYRQLLAGTEGE